MAQDSNPHSEFRNPQSSDEPWTVGRLLTWTTDYFRKQGVENPRLDAEVLLAAARGCRRIELYTSFEEEADDKSRTAYRELVRRRVEGTPVAYLVGHREFYSLEFLVTPDVLIPRPETELLVVALLDRLKERSESPAANPQLPTAPKIADVGTGSGILAVCAAKFVPGVQVIATDRSAAALDVARRNAERHGVLERIELVESDLLSGVGAEEQFDFILSNPPYVSTTEMDQLPREVREHEPRRALHAGDEGTEVIERLLPQAAARLKPGGLLILEISPMIAERVQELIEKQPGLRWESTTRDLAGHARVIQAVRV